tara:strand:- start:1533 stop:1940 length:408 start_codon:yes stop_codon:yes gene_type:complete
MIDPMLVLDLGFGALGALITLKKQASKDNHDMHMARIEGANNSANSAESRGAGWGRGFALVVVLSVGFLGLLYAAHAKIQVAQIVNVEPIIDFLFLKIGGGEKVVYAEGFVIPQYVEDSIRPIIFFLFGSSAAKR